MRSEFGRAHYVGRTAAAARDEYSITSHYALLVIEIVVLGGESLHDLP